eukprot:g16152.t1
MPLEDFLVEGMDEGLYDEETFLEPIYAFDAWRMGQGGEGNTHPPACRFGGLAEEPCSDMGLQLPGLPRIELPKAIRSLKTSLTQSDAAETVSMLGGPRSAVGWHTHGASLQMILHGRRPPSERPRRPLVYPTLSADQRPLECVVHAGDIVYVPDGWYHAVVNLADTVAVSYQSREMQPEAQHVFKSFSLPMAESLWRENPEAIEEQPASGSAQSLRNDLHARRALYYCMMFMDPEKAVEVILEGIRKDPYHIPMQFESPGSATTRVRTTCSAQRETNGGRAVDRLASWLSRRLKAGEEGLLDLVGELLAEWEPYLVANRRNQKALWILNKFHRALGDEGRADEYFERLVTLNEKGIDRRREAMHLTCRRRLPLAKVQEVPAELLQEVCDEKLMPIWAFCLTLLLEVGVWPGGLEHRRSGTAAKPSRRV